MEKKNRKIKFSKKLIAASLLAVVVLVNCIYSSFQQVAAQGRFEVVDQRISEIKSLEDDVKLKVLEILPDETSLSVMEMLLGVNGNWSEGTVSSYAFQELIKDYDNEDIEALANMLSQYGIINMDSTSSAVYPLTYYKPGDEERLYSNTPSLPETDEYGGYALVDTQLVVGSYEVVDKEEIKANAAMGSAETVYYQEVLLEEVSPSTPAEVTPSTPSGNEAPAYFIDEKNEKVYLKYNGEGFNKEIYDGIETGGRFFRFVADEANGGSATVDDSSSQSYTGYGYRFVFGSKAQIKSNKLFTKFVLGVTENVTEFTEKNIYLQTMTIDALGSMGDEYLKNSGFDLVYISNPFLKFDVANNMIKPHDFANAELTEPEKTAKYSQWVMLDMAGARNADNMLSAAINLLENVVNEAAPLKLIVDSSILDDYEKAITNCETIIDAVSTDESLSTSTAEAEAYLDKINNSQIYRSLLMLAQDNFAGNIRKICKDTAETASGTHNYKLIIDDSDEDCWNDISSEDLRAELYAADEEGNPLTIFGKTNGHFVNKNLYFYHYDEADYKKNQLTQKGLVIVQMVNGEFRSIMTKDLLRKGFRDVVTAIEDENRRNAYLENKREPINADEITVDMVVQYLLSYKGKAIEIKKNNLRVLEIQPCADFKYAYASEENKEKNIQTDAQKAFIEKWVSYFVEQDRYQDVSFTSMSIQEFIGKNEDLNATYDIIYIGSNIGKFQQHSNGDRKFNDSSMRGLIYTHVGDLVGDRNDTTQLARNVLRGLLDTDFENGDRTKGYVNVKAARTTGNDLTTYKKRDLLNFLESGYPIIVDEKLFSFGVDGNPNAINASGEVAKPVTAAPTPSPDPNVTVVPTKAPTVEPTKEPTVEPSKAPTKVKVYIRKKPELNQFDTVYLHLWKSGSSETIKCNFHEGNASDKTQNGFYWYSVEFEKSKGYTGFKIKGTGPSGDQWTDHDLSIPNSDEITLEFNSKSDVKVFTGKVGWPSQFASATNINGPKLAIADRATVATANIASEVKGTELNIHTTETVNASSTSRTIYVKKPKGWSDSVYVYMWGEGKNAEFPGEKATQIGTDGDYIKYEIEVPNKYDKIIVNKGSDAAKTSDISLGLYSEYTITLKDGYAYDIVHNTSTIQPYTPSISGTVDNSTYLYQLLKIATAQEGTVDTSEIKLRTLNSDDELADVVFDWQERTYKNLLVDRVSMTDSSASAEISQFLNETKIYINLTKRPKDYDYTTTGSDKKGPIKIEGEKAEVEYLVPDEDGRYYLDYEFSISTLAGSLNEKDFNCELFVDANFDGKFSKNSEFLDSIIIKEASTGKMVVKNEGEDFYRLQEGVAYTLTRKLPKSFDGCINWKLQISENGNDKIVAAETGYCAIPVKAKNDDGTYVENGGRQIIKILQVTSGDSTEAYTTRHSQKGTHVNLQSELGNTSGTWHKLLTNIPDFKLDITTISAKDFALKCKDSAYKTDYPLKVVSEDGRVGYDMIIIGFIDAYADVRDDSGKQITQYMAEALIKFGNAGKSILFTHDTNAWTANYLHKNYASDAEQNWLNENKWNSAYLTTAIRDLCGNDQYGVVTRKNSTFSLDTSTTDDTSIPYINEFFNTPASTGKGYTKGSNEWNELFNLGKDMAFAPNSGQSKVVGETQGSSYANLRIANWGYVEYVKGLMTDDTNLHNDADKLDIGKVNDGAITKYPYELPDEMRVGATHAQYWTVDIESDNNFDDESDLVVWYCINDRNGESNISNGAKRADFYDKSPNDVRNNYYIYNKGNITYTGAGHTPFSGEDEIKLFINTMIAAYNARIRLPEINIVENGEPEADNLENLIIPYDSNIFPEEDGKDFVNIGSTSEGSSDIAGTMKVFFNVYDGNLTAKNKKLKIDEIFITDSRATTSNANYKGADNNALKGHTYTKSKDPDTGSTVSDATKGVLPIYDAETDKLVEYDELISGKSYYVKAPLNTIFAKDQVIDLHITMHTIIGEGTNIQETGKVTDKLTISRAEIFDLD